MSLEFTRQGGSKAGILELTYVHRPNLTSANAFRFPKFCKYDRTSILSSSEID